MKRMLLIISVVLIFAAALLLWDSVLLRDVAQTAHDSQSGAREDNIPGNMTGNIPGNMTGNIPGNMAGGTLDSTAKDVDPNGVQASLEASDVRAILSSELVPVTGNTPEYEMELTLCEGDDLKVFLSLEYFQNGISVMKELGEGQLPEISALSDNTSSQRDVTNTTKIKKALLNPVYGQLYLLIQGGLADEFRQTSFYRIDLADMAVNKLFTYSAKYGEMVFNRDFSLLAYSFDDPPHMSVYQEDKVLEVYDCKKGEYVVKGNKDANHQPIGINHSKGYLYDYEFVEWESLDVVRLKQGTRKMTDLDIKPVISEVVYDIRKNLLMSSDGSQWKIASDDEGESVDGSSNEGSGSTDTPGSNEQEDSAEGASTGEDISVDTADNQNDASDMTASDPTTSEPTTSEPVKTLKSFYKYLQSEESYDKAMQLLDDKFKLRMAMLMQFGVVEISKSDIDAEYDQDSVSLYSDLLKAAKLDTISKETVAEDNTVIITYYQKLGLSADSQVRQLMSAKLVQVNKEYKIVLIEDGVQ